ncbi:DUF559 domain-containing protein [Kineococcus xinjiangensis]|uniref:DUF559 domain-containing protein n=1 Tax=Kineococcus xinjiangensis TaxID=512762 RepID=UPI000CEBA25E|nr:DUF559 domain-containing protein [Kineococcus xinjiangensis]
MTRRWDDDWQPPVAVDQAGVFTVAQAVAAGMPERTAHRRARSLWVQVGGRGYRLGAAGPPALQQGWAAVLTWPTAVLAGPTAAAVHGMPVSAPDAAHVLLPRHPRRRAGLVAHVAVHPAAEVTTAHGLVLTTPPRTVLDCLRWSLDPRAAEDLLAWACTRRVLDRRALAAAVRRHHGCSGTATLRRALAPTAGGAVNGAERQLHRVLRAAGLRGWRGGARVELPDGSVAVVDVLFDRERVVVELDGYAAHSGQRAFVGDRRRQNALVAAGFTVLRFAWEDVHGRPAVVTDQIRSVLRPHSQG